ncbi:hypothetical protein [Haloarcula amylovorans]|uniref:hypothetical protein n=1 Tax=Haloarcula amylovorans TaxID=2562280 RepID=UPI001FD83D96|nr:hypothetical protein [Halomicroarcula amylolytica]
MATARSTASASPWTCSDATVVGYASTARTASSSARYSRWALETKASIRIDCSTTAVVPSSTRKPTAADVGVPLSDSYSTLASKARL